MIDKPISYGRQYITDDDIAAVVKTLKSDFLTQGPKIKEFESNFATYCNAKYDVMVSNGTAALHLAAMALGIQPGDKVITTPITFVASANGFRYCGAEIVFCDIDPKNFLMDLDKLENILKSSPKGTFKAVIPVDFAGYPVDGERLRALADEYGFAIVEDACHAPGGSFIDSKGIQHMVGDCAYADMTVFSYHPVKHIATGEGGSITTNRKDLFDKLSLYRTHGITSSNVEMTEEVSKRFGQEKIAFSISDAAQYTDKLPEYGSMIFWSGSDSSCPFGEKMPVISVSSAATDEDIINVLSNKWADGIATAYFSTEVADFMQ